MFLASPTYGPTSFRVIDRKVRSDRAKKIIGKPKKERSFMACHKVSGHVYDEACDVVPNYQDGSVGFFNALSENLPECNRIDHLKDVVDFEPLDVCFVYCAQKSCDAAEKFMEKHASILREGCNTITYLHSGAVAMNPDELVAGEKCHQKIREHNEAQTVKEASNICLTCNSSQQGTPIPLTWNGEVLATAKMVSTKGTVPDWYVASGNYSTLPPQFTCNSKYGNPPKLHQGKGNNTIEIDISQTDLPPNSIIGYWAAKPSKDALPPKDAYADFSNSGIIQCRNNKCRLKLDTPGVYKVDRETFPSHMHFTEWTGRHWNPVGKTIQF